MLDDVATYDGLRTTYLNCRRLAHECDVTLLWRDSLTESCLCSSSRWEIVNTYYIPPIMKHGSGNVMAYGGA